MTRLGAASRSRNARTNYVTEPKGGGRHLVDVRTVACPDCSADLGVACTTPNGKRTTHRARTRMATRLRNESFADWDSLVAVTHIDFKERRAIARRLGTSYVTLAAELDVPYASLVRWFRDQQPPSTEAGVRFAAWILDRRVGAAR